MAYLTANKIATIVANLRASLFKPSMTTILTEVNTAIQTDAAGAEAHMPAVAGTAEASKIAWLGANKNLDTIVVADGGLYLGAGAGTAVSSTAAELNILDGVTADASELNILDGVTASASELNILDGVTADASELNILDGVTSSASELNILDGVTADANEINLLDGTIAGTAVASKVLALGVDKNIDVLAIADGGLSLGAGAGTAITSTAAELNILDGVTADANELNLLDGTTAGTAVASKVLALGADKNADEFHTAALYLGAGAGTLVTATAADLNVVPSIHGMKAVGVLRAASSVADKETVTIGADVYEVDTETVANITPGRIRLNLSGGSTVKSQGTLTIDTQITSGDTMTIGVGAGVKVYTFVPNGTANADGEVDVGTDLATCKTALVAAVNGADGHNVAHTQVTIAAFVVNNAVLTAIVGGVFGDTIATTETFTAGTNIFDAATLGTTTAGVNPTAGEFTTALEAAINASGTETITATRHSANEVGVYKDAVGVDTTALAETLGGVNNAWDTVALRGGSGTSQRKEIYTSRVPNATEVAVDQMHFMLDFTPTWARAEVRVTAGGAIKAWDGAMVLAAGRVTLTNGGATDWAATDTVYLHAVE